MHPPPQPAALFQTTIVISVNLIKGHMATRNPAAPGKLVWLWSLENASSQLQSLAGNDVGSFDSTFTSNAEAFLVKRYRSFGIITLMPLDVSLFIFMNGPGANQAEAEVAIEEEVNDPDDVSNWDAYLRQNRLIVNTIAPIQGRAGRIDNDPVPYDTGWMTVGARGKGIPFPEGHGPELFIYNLLATLPADPVHDGFTIYEGVYLGD